MPRSFVVRRSSFVVRQWVLQPAWQIERPIAQRTPCRKARLMSPIAIATDNDRLCVRCDTRNTGDALFCVGCGVAIANE
jgi:hypothetical protein